MDGLCIPHRDLIPEFVTAGLPQERLFPTGIPVGQQFLHPESREEARRALNLPVDGRILTPSAAAGRRTPAYHRSEGSGAHGAGGSAGHHLRQQPPDVSADAERFLPPCGSGAGIGPYPRDVPVYVRLGLLLTKAGGASPPPKPWPLERRCCTSTPSPAARHAPRLCVGGQQRRRAPAHAAGHSPGPSTPEHGRSSGGILPTAPLPPCLRFGPGATRRCVKITIERKPRRQYLRVLFGFRSEGPHPWNRESGFGVFFSAYRPASAPRFAMTQGSAGSQLRGASTAAHAVALGAAMPMKPRPEIIWRLSDSNMVILRLYDWSKIVLFDRFIRFQEKTSRDPCKNYQAAAYSSTAGKSLCAMPNQRKSANQT